MILIKPTTFVLKSFYLKKGIKKKDESKGIRVYIPSFRFQKDYFLNQKRFLFCFLKNLCEKNTETLNAMSRIVGYLY